MSREERYTWQVMELDFTSETRSGKPYMNLQMSVDFVSPEGLTYKTPGFWDGNNQWKVRLAPHIAGIWTWTSSSRDSGLDGKHGSFEVKPYIGKNRIYQHGFLHTQGRSFVHKDGTPFFWLGDTVWSVSSHATKNEWREYLNYRSRQGYNVVQINSLPQWDASDGIYRRPFVEIDGNYDYTRLNTQYFQYLDQLMADSVAAGMLTAMVVLWFNYVPETNLSWGKQWKRQMDIHTAEAFASYLSARYAAYGTIWLISGDTDYESSKAEEIYDAAAYAVREASPYPPLLTAHLNGGLFTPEKLNAKKWLDFHMLQSCHSSDSAEKALLYAEKDRAYDPVRPVINGEPCYDSLRLMDKDNDDNRLINREFVRETAWTSLLGGANAGITYGAHGLWPWHKEGQTYGPMNYGMPLSWQAALKLESGEDMIYMKQILESLPYGELQLNLSVTVKAENVRVVASSTHENQQLVVYISQSAPLDIEADLTTMVSGIWYDPSNGLSMKADLTIHEASFSVAAPNWTGDAVLVLQGE